MNDKVKNMIKSVVEENAVEFKQSTAKALYEKIGNRLGEQYKTVSRDLFKKKVTIEESAMAAADGGTSTPSPSYYPQSPSTPPGIPNPGFNPQQTAPWTGQPREGDTVKDKQGNTWIYVQNPDGSYEWRKIPKNMPTPGLPGGKPGKIRPQSPNRRSPGVNPTN